MRVIEQLSHRPWVCELALGLTAVERAGLRFTNGRRSISGFLGVPLCLLWTRGARTGRWRGVPLICTRYRDAHIVLGSNGGRPEHPQWTNNLRYGPRAAITLDGATAPVRARLLTGSERAALWPLAVQTWPPYETYARRSGRELRMFCLSPEQ